MKQQHIILLLLCFNLIGCEHLALLTIPQKKPELSNTTIAKKAKSNFWNTFHQGKYHNIDEADKLLMAAYLKSPTDCQLASYIGFLHIWKITERQRNAVETPLITNEVILSKEYFADALALQPKNSIYQGFYGDSLLVEGDIFQDKSLELKGYFTIERAIQAWPEFNYFTAGYVMSTLPATAKHFQEALLWQWKTLDLCSNSKFNHENANYGPFLQKNEHLDEKKQRACFNTWVAPHNLEGFFMNMGDMLVKSGDWKTAKKIYQNAKRVKSYSYWPYKDMLNKRIKNAQENVSYFQKKKPSTNPDRAVLFNSGYGCVVCHQDK